MTVRAARGETGLFAPDWSTVVARAPLEPPLTNS